MSKAGSSASETEVTWEDQQNINKFGRLNNRLHEVEDEIKIAKVFDCSGNLISESLSDYLKQNMLSDIHHFIVMSLRPASIHSVPTNQVQFNGHSETNESLEDAGNELILTDEEIVRFQIGEVFAHVPKEEVESRIEEMTEKTSNNLVKLEEEKESIIAQMAVLKKILYGKFKDYINLEED
ncbi:hypothetical protein SASPL_111019 [Salvia splendens]|uniref:Prefoldin subunit 4 n=1 Tax=Salvia splendens TaxID=180675 RepID=A0A8X8YB41_SALSN|nr:hypothetical protein SASPL_111019 [Salvia splendens]